MWVFPMTSRVNMAIIQQNSVMVNYIHISPNVYVLITCIHPSLMAPTFF